MPPIKPLHNYPWRQAAWSWDGGKALLATCCPLLQMGSLCLPLGAATGVRVAEELGHRCCGVTRRAQGQGIPRVLEMQG